MCGIYGSTRMYDIQMVNAKLARANFRGPDASKVACFDEVLWMGHNRLAIIDLDERSHQPFRYMGLRIVFNGEIYNFLEIKAELIKLGFVFSTTSDTEVICAAYKQWGKQCVQHFNGMFSFVIYDSENCQLFGARDRLGKKPFYYSLANGQFEFASQPSQIAMGNRFSTDEKSVSQFLIWQQIPDPATIYNEVKRLRAGNYFLYNLKEKSFTETSYWDLDGTAYNTYTGTYHDAVNDLDVLLHDTVSKRMIADVPLGIFLSGGVDSSLIAAIAQKQSAIPVRTFAIKFDERKFDESPYAAEVARHLGTNHTTITCSMQEAVSLIENYGHFYDEPFADASALPSMLLAKHTRKHVTVALSGDGGDESFIGYSRYDWIHSASKLFQLPDAVRKSASYFAGLLPNKRMRSAGELLGSASIEMAYQKLMSSFNPTWLINPKEAASNEYIDWLYSNAPLLERVSNYDIKTYMNNDINTKVDRATMAYSLEARAPLMDYRVVAFSRALPIHFKYADGVKKRILKDVLYKYVPKEMMDRPKQGFGVPLASWFRSDLKALVLDSLTEKHLQQIPNLNVTETQRIIKSHLDGTEDRHVIIWNLLVLVQWMNTNK